MQYKNSVFAGIMWNIIGLSGVFIVIVPCAIANLAELNIVISSIYTINFNCQVKLL
jgi:hypothetical protein